MAHKKKKRSQVDDELDIETPGKRNSPSAAEDQDSPFPAGRREEAAFRDDDDFGELPNIVDAHSPYEPDPQEVDMLTDRIFGSVLSKFGWERHGDRIEHVGDKDRQRR